MKSGNSALLNIKDSIFGTMTKMAFKNNAINLSQGFPDFDGPDWMKNLVTKAMNNGYNQYAPTHGILELRQILSENYRKNYNLNYDPIHEITITNGATEALSCTILGLVEPGDEVIVLEPFFDSYISSLELARAKIIPVTLYRDSFNFDKEEMRKAFSDKTKLIILNTPHNPTGKVFSKSELEFIVDLACKHDAFIISDEVYEYLTFDNHIHIPTASIKRAQERTITISSSGKTFGFTGWKIGWALAPEKISHYIRMVHQYNTFSVCTPMQWGVAEALQNLDRFLPEFKKSYTEKRDYFCQGLKEVGHKPIIPQGTYFTISPIQHLTSLSDVGYCMELIEKKKVAAIPPSAFYLKSTEGLEYIRFCFAKKQETLEQALKNLKSRL